MFNKVIVGDDGLDGGADALALARAIAPDAELILASAYPWDETPSRFAQLGYGNLLRDDTVEALHKRRDDADLAGARTVAIPDTSPARALQHLAEAEGADLIVTGTASHGAVGRMLLGDVSRDVLHGSPCPVAVAPRGFTTGRPATIGVAFDFSPESEHALALAVELAAAIGAQVKMREVVAADLWPMMGGYPIINLNDISEELVADAEERMDAKVAELHTDVAVEIDAVLGATADRPRAVRQRRRPARVRLARLGCDAPRGARQHRRPPDPSRDLPRARRARHRQWRDRRRAERGDRRVGLT